MQRYSGFGGRSGVVAYEIGADWIEVQFSGGDIYRYTDSRSGAENVATMKHLAFEGRGLASFISKAEDMRYAAKRRAEPHELMRHRTIGRS